MEKKITMSDIAAELGISVVTVSKALSGQKGVSEAMREKITQLAKDKGYQKSFADKEKTNYKIGIIVSENYFGKVDSFYGHMYQIFSARAGKIGAFTMLEIVSMEDEANLEYPKLVGNGNVDAIVIIGSLKLEYLEMLNERLDTPVFYLDFSNSNSDNDAVISDSYYGAYILTNYLFSMGHTKIGFVGTLLSTSSITDRYMGYMRSMMEHGVEIDKSWILDDREGSSKKVDIDKCIKLPDKKNMPTAFVCNSDLTASLLVKYLQDRGISVPDDVSIVGYDDFLFTNVDGMGITTYKVDMEEMVKKILRKVIHYLNGDSYKKGISIIEGRLVERDSVKRLS